MQLILTSRTLPGVPGVCWFLDLKHGDRLTSLTNGTHDHCLEQKAYWHSIIEQGLVETLLPSCYPQQPNKTQTMSIDITHILGIRNEPLPVFLKYEGQTKPQPAYIEMDSAGVVIASANPEIGNAVTMDVWHQRTLQWSIDPG